MEVELAEIRDFLAEFLPFSLLDARALDALPKMLSVRYLRRGTSFPPIEETEPCLYIIRKGAIERRNPEGLLIDRLCEGDSCIADGVDSVSPPLSPLVGTAIEDSLMYLLPCSRLAALRQEQAALDEYFVRSAAERLRHGRRSLLPNIQTDSSLMTLPVRTFGGREPVGCAPTFTIREAACRMAEAEVSALLVLASGQICGIITDRDLRKRCLASGLSPDAPIATIMTTDVITIGPESAAFEALMLMTKMGIHHLPVVDAAGLRGLISSTDLMHWQSANAVYLAGLIRKARNLADLTLTSAELPELQIRLHASGATPGQIGQAVSSLTDAVTIRLIEIAQTELGPAPIDFAWVACGTQGRHEQTVHTDQDNALILDDSFDEKAHGRYFESLASRVNDGLDACGYRYCPGKVMAGNPAWRQPQRIWIEHFRQWIGQAGTMAAMLAANFLDMRCVFGEAALLLPLHQAINASCSRHEAFLARMVANALENKPPLGFFRNFTLIANGEHAKTFDIKHGGLIPITDLARIHALASGRAEIGTLARLRASGLAELGAESAQELGEAFEYFGSLRLRHQSEQIRRGVPPDNFILPGSLTALERSHLKDAFAVVGRLQDILAQRYAAHLGQ